MTPVDFVVTTVMPHGRKQKRSAESMLARTSGAPDTINDCPAENTAIQALPVHAPATAETFKQPKQQQAANTAEHEHLQASAKTKALPVLPWMRVPVSIEDGTGIPLSQVKGLHPFAHTALQASKKVYSSFSMYCACLILFASWIQPQLVSLFRQPTATCIHDTLNPHYAQQRFAAIQCVFTSNNVECLGKGRSAEAALALSVDSWRHQ